jgi:hypothetical protein
MEHDFQYDVFLSHSAKDKAVVRSLAERLRADGLKVWLDEWVLKPGDSIPAKVEEGLEHSRVLMLCMSANAFGSDWAQLEAGTFRFRDPLNTERRFIPLRLDDAPIKGSLAQFLYINYLPAVREEAYAKLLQACRRPTTWPKPEKSELGSDGAKSYVPSIRHDEEATPASTSGGVLRESRTPNPPMNKAKKPQGPAYVLSRHSIKDWSRFLVGVFLLFVAVAFAAWGFSKANLTADQREILLWILPLASGFAACAFAGSLSVKAKGFVPGLVITAASGFGVWLLSCFLLFPRPKQESNRGGVSPVNLAQLVKEEHPYIEPVLVVLETENGARVCELRLTNTGTEPARAIQYGFRSGTFSRVIFALEADKTLNPGSSMSDIIDPRLQPITKGEGITVEVLLGYSSEHAPKRDFLYEYRFIVMPGLVRPGSFNYSTCREMERTKFTSAFSLLGIDKMLENDVGESWFVVRFPTGAVATAIQTLASNQYRNICFEPSRRALEFHTSNQSGKSLVATHIFDKYPAGYHIICIWWSGTNFGLRVDKEIVERP